MRICKIIVSVTALLFASVSLDAMQNPASQVQVQRSGDNPIYKITINVVERTTKAINYHSRSGPTTFDFRGTPLLAPARHPHDREQQRSDGDADRREPDRRHLLQRDLPRHAEGGEAELHQHQDHVHAEGGSR